MSARSEYSLAPSDLTFGELLRILERRKWIIAANVVLALIIGFLITYFSPERWTGSLRLEVLGRTQTNPMSSPDPAIARVAAAGSNIDVPTQVELVQSQAVLLDSLEAADIPLPTLTDPDSIERAPQITASQVQLTNVIGIEIEAASEAHVARLREEIPDIFEALMRDRVKVELENSQRRADAELTTARRTRDTAQKAVNDFLSKEQITTIEEEAARRQQEFDRAQESVRLARTAMESAQGSYDTKRALLQNLLASEPTIEQETEIPNREERRRYEEQIEAVEADLTVKRETYQDSHPIIRSLAARLDSLKEQLSQIPERLVNKVRVPNPQIEPLRQDVGSALAVLEGSKRALNFALAEAGQSPPSAGEVLAKREQLSRLQNTLDERQASLQALVSLSEELKVKSEQVNDLVKDVTQTSPIRQVSPRWGVNLILAGLAGLVLGLIVALARDIALDQVNLPEEAAGLAGAEVMARIPHRGRGRGALITDPQKARAFEAYRLLRAGVLAQLEQAGGKSLLVTSTEEGEGKTVVVGNLGVAMTLDGRRTLIIDGNLRNPKLADLMGAQVEKGLDAVLLGRAELKDAVAPTRVPHLDLLAPAAPVANSTEALASPQMQDLIRAAEAAYDIVLIDSPESYSTADARELSRHAAGVIFVVEPQAAGKGRMEEAVSLIRQAGSRIFGVVMNKDRAARSRMG